jgi:NAD(P)-dependent dehydrogenase (short-subunit alcohol dehydrogenase family)
MEQRINGSGLTRIEYSLKEKRMQRDKARFSDKVAIVLGVSNENSIGGAVAGHLIQEGAKVIITARTAEKVDAVASKINAVGEVCEIADERQVSELADKARERYGRLDVAVNCAGLALMGYIESQDVLTTLVSS